MQKSKTAANSKPPASAWEFASHLASKREKLGFDGSFDSTYSFLSVLAKKEMKRFPPSELDGKSFRSIDRRLEFILASKNKIGFFRRLLTQTPLETRAGANFEFDWRAYERLQGKQKIRFLDAGSGFDESSSSSPNTLNTVEYFHSKGVEITAVAIDIAIPDALSGKKKDGITYVAADIASDLGAHGEFDYIRCANVLWHYGDGKRMVILRNLEKIRAEKGVLAVGSSNGMEGEIFLLRKGDRISDFF